jgi:TrmH family RNA methyltransferase
MRRTTHLSSHDNPSVKDALRLRERRGRKKSRRFLVEGTREVLRALEAGWKPETLCVEEVLTARNPVRERAEDVADVVAYVTRDVYGKLAMREDREGILAVFEIRPPSRRRVPDLVTWTRTPAAQPGSISGRSECSARSVQTWCSKPPTLPIAAYGGRLPA